MTKLANFYKISHQMQAGDVIAFAGEHLVSRLITWVTGGDISHIGVITIANPGNPVAIHVEEALAYGVVRSRLNHYAETYNGEVYWLPLRDDVRNALDITAMEDFLHRHDGAKYNYVRAAESGLFRKVGLHESPPELQKFFCSELAIGALQAGGVVPDSINIAEVTPHDLCEMPLFKPRVRFR